MNCRYHPTRTAVNTCSMCGDWLCDECTADAGGRIYCGSCLQKYWAQEHTAPPKAYPYHPARHECGRNVSFGVLLFFSICMPPGVNYMYEGLIKRGLFFLSSFFLTIYLLASLRIPVFAFLIPIMYITCIFDAFRTRKRLIAGESVPDSVDDILGFIRKYKTSIIIFLLFVIGLKVLDTIGNVFFSFPSLGYVRYLFSRKIIPFLVLLGGICLIIFSGKRSKPSSYDDRESTDKNKK